jgi:spermidine synthase
MVGDSVPVVGCLGQNGEFSIDPVAIDRRLADAAVAGRAREVNLGSACLLLSHFVMGRAGLEQMTEGMPLNTDDRPVIEFLSPLHSMRPRGIGVSNLVDLEERFEDVGGVAPDALAKIRRCAAAKRTIIKGLRDVPDARIGRYMTALGEDPTNEDLRTVVADLMEQTGAR